MPEIRSKEASLIEDNDRFIVDGDNVLTIQDLDYIDEDAEQDDNVLTINLDEISSAL